MTAHSPTVLAFLAGLALGFILGYFVRGLLKAKRNADVRNVDALAVLISLCVVGLWGLAHVYTIFVSGGEVNWILNVIGGLAVSSLIQERDGFVKIISAIRGGNSDKK